MAEASRARITMAWHTAALGRAVPMPELGDLLDVGREQTNDEAIFAMQALAAATSNLATPE